MRKESDTKDYFWQAQGLTSFCKAKSDWMQYDKVHLSFVKHSGRQYGCKQVLAIEGALKIHGADGALYLAELVLRGAAKKLADKSRTNPGQNGYLRPIFTSMGGTVASRSADGKCVFRQVSLAPGSKSDYVLSMMTCDGEETGTGGIQPVKGAKRETIFVALSAADLVDFARSVQTEYTAYRTSVLLHNSPAAPAPSAAEPQAVAPQVPTMLVLMYESSGMYNKGLPFATTLGEAPTLLDKLVRATLKAPQAYRLKDASAVTKAKQLFGKGDKASTIINFVGANGATTALVVVVDSVK